MTAPRRITDPALPGLAAALDAHAVRDALRRALPECADGVEITAVSVSDVRYEPGVRAELLYRLKVRDAVRDRSGRVVLVAQLLAEGARPEPPPRELLERYARDEDALLRTAHAWLPELGVAVTAYPVDPHLPTLPDALDARAVRDALGELWRERGLRVRAVEVEALGYTAHNRAALRYDVLAEDRRTRVPEMRRLIGKLHGKKPADRLFAGSWALWRALETRCRLAPPVGYLPALGVTLQEQVRGERLGALADQPAFAKRVRQTARALAALHAAEIPLATRRKPQEEARVVQRWSGVLSAIRPDLAPRIDGLRDRLTAALEQRTQLSGPVHADFHHTNVLVDADGITIIDLDEMAYGDPLLDVGRFLASLRIPSLRLFGNVHALDDARGVFLDEYLKRRPDDERRARLFEAACLFTAAASAFRTQRQEWPAEVELLLAEAESVVDRAGVRAAQRRSEPPDPGPFPIAADPRLWANDVVYMRTLLAQPLQEAYGGDISAFAVEPQDEEELLARYEVKGRSESGRWSAVLEAIPLPGGNAAIVRRLESLRAALADISDAPLLPRPLVHVRQLGMVVVEAPQGQRLSALLGTPLALEAAERLAHALAALHGAQVELDRARSWSDELRQLERRVQRLAETRPQLHAAAADLLARLRGRDAMSALAPALNCVRPHDVLYDAGRVAFARVDNPMLGPPATDAAEFLARLTLSALRHGDSTHIAAVQTRFRAVYGESQVTAANDIDATEAAALLRLACSTADRRDDDDTAARLLHTARALL